MEQVPLVEIMESPIMRLGQILLQKKWISSNQLKQTIDIQKTKQEKLGTILVNKGYIANEQLSLALQEQYWRNNGFWVID
ncbi:MAG: hypothetical protein AB4041_01280 [Microcystaceae cyanobacterium]